VEENEDAHSLQRHPPLQADRPPLSGARHSEMGKIVLFARRIFDAQATRVAKAKERAIAAGTMAWLDEEAKT
jgi:hypothetical protein